MQLFHQLTDAADTSGVSTCTLTREPAKMIHARATIHARVARALVDVCNGKQINTTGASYSVLTPRRACQRFCRQNMRYLCMPLPRHLVRYTGCFISISCPSAFCVIATFNV